MMIKALALDLDGTLTNSEKTITPRTKAAVFAAMDSGIDIILASGRPMLGVEPSARALELYARGGYMIAYNGGEIMDCKRRKMISRRLLSTEIYRDIVECGRRFGVHALTYDDNSVLAESDMAEYVIKEAYNNSIPVTKTDDLIRTVTEPVVKFMIVGEPEKIKPALAYAKSLLEGRAHVFLSEPYFIEISPVNTEKASALGILTEYMGIVREELAVCGDGLNDIPMLSFAGFPVAMENAYDETKKAARYITASNDRDGVAVFIEKLLAAGRNPYDHFPTLQPRLSC
jgi:Cof subfamily protein (haloacid dehalogenase superfamily)